jgi:hypothetical protein
VGTISTFVMTIPPHVNIFVLGPAVINTHYQYIVFFYPTMAAFAR